MDEISIWLMLSFYKTEVSKTVFNPPLKTHSHRWRDGPVFDLFDLILFPDKSHTS